jgi:cytoskeletal protein CcmA (bactofilin family)
MGNVTLTLQRIVCFFLLIGLVKEATAQTLKIEDFAIWGGSAAASSYNSSQGVVLGTNTTIQGNVGSNHLIDAQSYFTLSGNLYSANAVTLGSNGKVTGNIFAAKTSSGGPKEAITGQNKLDFIGNLYAKGKIKIPPAAGPNATTIMGQVAVPTPVNSNYSGPAPSGGIVDVNTISFPVLPAMPDNMAFDNLAGTTNITNTVTLTPGSYKKLALTGSKTITFSGPGDYIFDEVANGTSANKLVFDFKNTTDGMINILIIKNAQWGKISVKMVNGNEPSRIYTEVHGNGSSNSGAAFSLDGPGLLPSGDFSWLGSVWAPNGNIAIKLYPLHISSNFRCTVERKKSGYRWQCDHRLPAPRKPVIGPDSSNLKPERLCRLGRQRIGWLL